MTVDFIEAIRLADKLAEVVRAAKIIYGDQWEEKKRDTLALIDMYKDKNGVKTRLAAAIQMSGILKDDNLTIVLLAAAADSKE